MSSKRKVATPRCGFSYQRTEQIYKSRPSVQEVADFEAELEKNDRLQVRSS